MILSKSIYFLLCTLFFVLCVGVDEQRASNVEREALLDLYSATKGNNWKNNSNWGFGEPCLSNWYGVSCIQERVSFLTMRQNNLDGTIPHSISDLQALFFLDLSENKLHGAIPSELFSIASIRVIELNDNDLSGTIYSEIGNLRSLQRLDLSWCNITGEIPSTITNCTSLQILSLPYNTLSGTIPELNNMTNLEEINLSSNFLSGDFPSSFCNLPMLSSVDLSENRLTGSIPDTIFQLSLVELLLSYNQISGTIPESLYSIQSLEVLTLSGNILSGTISASISNLVSLQKLDLSLNSFSGQIPSLNKLVRLKYLDLSTCDLEGSLPKFTYSTQIEFIDISANKLSGTLPDSAPPLHFLRDFDASSNALGGFVPEWVVNVKFSMYLVDNPFLCPYPEGGVWYQGLFFLVVCILELFCFMATSVVAGLAATFGLRPALVNMLAEDDGKELEVDKLHRWSRYLGKLKNAVLASAVVEVMVSFLLAIVGIAIRIRAIQLYHRSLVIVSLFLAFCFFFKSLALLAAVRKNMQRLILGLTSFQLLQLGFIPIAFSLEGLNSQATQLSCVVVFLIVVDTISNIFASLTVFLIQDQFIPVRHLKLDDKLKDAEGVFGEVCHGKYFGMDIAVKRAKPETKQERHLIYQAFLREAKILGDLGNHPNIVKLIGISPMLKDEFYIVMEYCDNRDALSYLKKMRREEDFRTWILAVLKLCIGVCDAMRYLHSRGYTHRDITACNILVKGERAMLADLGLARKDTDEIDPEDDIMPQNHSLYAPPEIAEHPENYSQGCDIYCFGIALWEMLMLKRWSHEYFLNRAKALEQLDAFPLFFKNIVCHCWHEEDAFRPSFDELLREFTTFYQQDWCMYREVVVEKEPVTQKRTCRVRAYSIVDIAENSSYQANPPPPFIRGESPTDSYRIASGNTFNPLSIN